MLEAKKLVLYAIVPALIAGLFSIAPKLYDIITTPSANLTYTITRGPELSYGNHVRRITSLKVFNSGKKSLQNVQAELSLPAGEFESYKVSESNGLHPIVKPSKTAVSTNVATLHPGEDFIIVAMELVPDLNVQAQVHLRSNEAVGKPMETESKSKKKPLDALGAILSGLSVFFMAILVSSRLASPKREDIVFYVLMRSGLTELSDKIKFSSDVLTYLRTADILLELGLSGDEENRTKCLKALKCFLLVSGMAGLSRRVVEKNIQRLAGESYSSKEITSIKKNSASMFSGSKSRDIIDKYIDNPASFEAG